MSAPVTGSPLDRIVGLVQVICRRLEAKTWAEIAAATACMNLAPLVVEGGHPWFGLWLTVLGFIALFEKPNAEVKPPAMASYGRSA